MNLESGEGIPSRFQRETIEAVGALQTALHSMIAVIPGHITRPIHLQRALSLDSKLCWQIFNIVRADDRLHAAQFVPGAPSLKRLLQAATRIGVNADITNGVRAAIDAFNVVVASHASDRSSFDSMAVAGSGGDKSSAIDLHQRRAAYRAESHIWGVQMEAAASCTIIRRASQPGLFDLIMLSFRRQHRRLRPDSRLIVSAVVNYEKKPEDPNAIYSLPLDAEAQEKYKAPLLPQFCSKPLPEMELVNATNHPAQFVQLAGEEVGKPSSIDLTFCRIYCNVTPETFGPGNKHLVPDIRIRTPLEISYADIVVHRPSFGKIHPEVAVYSTVDRDPMGASALPPGGVVFIGSADNVTSPDQVPVAVEAMHYTMAKMGWNPAEFDVYRMATPYPILNTTISVTFDFDPLPAPDQPQE